MLISKTILLSIYILNQKILRMKQRTLLFINVFKIIKYINLYIIKFHIINTLFNIV